MKLEMVQFRTGVSVAVGGKYSSLRSWHVSEHGADITCDEQKNGDIWLTTKDGRRRVVKPWAVDVTVYVPDEGLAKIDTTPRRNV